MMVTKSPLIILTFTLLFFSFTVLASQSSFGPENCCFNFFSKRLPKSKVVSYKYTDMRCPIRAVLFKMKSGVEICAGPFERWVKNIISIKSKAVKGGKRSRLITTPKQEATALHSD